MYNFSVSHATTTIDFMTWAQIKFPKSNEDKQKHNYFD